MQLQGLAAPRVCQRESMTVESEAVQIVVGAKVSIVLAFAVLHIANERA